MGCPRPRPASSGVRRPASLPILDEPHTTHIGTGEPPRAADHLHPAGQAGVDPRRAVRGAPEDGGRDGGLRAFVSGWATAVIATDLITGWWASDRLFCVAVGFLTLVSAAALISGLIALLLRRRMARLLDRGRLGDRRC